MRLTLKVVLATVLGTLLVLLVFGSVRSRREIDLFDSDIRKDHRLIGSTLAVCVATTWSSAGPGRALQLIQRADADRPELRIRWIKQDGTQNTRPPIFHHSLPERLREIEQAVYPDPNASAHTFLVTRVPVRDQGVTLGAIEIAESLDDRDEFILASAWNMFQATMAMVLVSGIVVLVVGVWFVGRPLDMLANKAKRVGHGDLSGPLRLPQRDEIGQLAAQVNSMCERLAEANARSETEAQARTKALEQLRHADRLITVGKLAAGIAHELGTPLNVVAGRVKMLRRGNVDPKLTEEYLAAIAEQTERMTATIRQLMEFARRREPRISSTDLVAIAGSIVRLLEPLSRKRAVSVRVATTDPVLARVDARRVEQVVSNLVVNAIHACKEGGTVELSCGLGASPSDPNRRCAFLCVSDDGHGMTEELMAHIFEPFFTTKEIGQGTGLGLSVAHGIVQEHHGEISVQSSPGRGSRFSVYFDAVES